MSRKLLMLWLAAAFVAVVSTLPVGAVFASDPVTTKGESHSERRQGEGDQDYARRLFDQGVIVSLESIVEQAKQLRPGELLEVELERKRGRHVYEVEVLDAAGQTWELKFDARDGRLIEEERENH